MAFQAAAFGSRRARDVLIDPAGSDLRIADIANRYGFWHMGQFAADYRRMFAELPSETWKRAVER